jgi:DNA polymerase III epsilon subunit-like protein
MKSFKFVVVDTEGSDLLKEIAIIDCQGALLYQALVQEHPDNQSHAFNTKPLKEVIANFLTMTQDHQIVCHYADHDRRILQRACRDVGIRTRLSRQFVCSCKLAQQYFPNLPSYSLEYLSKKLHLQVNHHYFNPWQAHAARYDAEFTYKLYCKILEMQSIQSLADQPNPFGSSRVDTPFQDHPDQKRVYQTEFDLLKATIQDIRQDKNHQSRGAVVIGEPGSGKTHLMMRLAKELLQVNRLLFIRHPNNPDAILHHIYSRILESFIEKVPENGYTQLENLLTHSFVKLISTNRHINLTKNDRIILTAVADTPLNLYKLTAEGTERKRLLWQHIEKRTSEWWINEYGFAGHSTQIIKGIIKFCSYSDPKRKQIVARWLAANELEQSDLELVGLTNWNEDFSNEEFSLEAISVFSKLSLLDEPLIIVFDQLEGLGLSHNQTLLFNFGEAVKEIFTHVPNSLIILNLFPDRWQQFQQVLDPSVVERMAQTQIRLNRPNNQALQEILQLKAQTVGIDINTFFTPTERETILSQPSIRAVLNCAADYFRHKVQGIPVAHRSVQEPVSSHVAQSAPDSLTLEQRLTRLETGFAALQQVFSQLAHVFTYPTEPSSQPAATQSASEQPPLTQASPLLEYLQTQRRFLRQEYSRPQIITDSDDLGKLITIAEACKTLKPFEIDYLQFGKRRLPENLMLQSSKRTVAVGFLQLDGSAFTSRIKNWNELVISYDRIHFQLWRDVRQAEISGKVGREEIEKLNHSSNGVFLLMEQEQRLDFELLYRLIVDIQNRDLEIDLAPALQTTLAEFKNSWICQLLDLL